MSPIDSFGWTWSICVELVECISCANVSRVRYIDDKPSPNVYTERVEDCLPVEMAELEEDAPPRSDQQ